MKIPDVQFDEDCQFVIAEDELITMFNKHPIDIWVNSFGGCRHNYIRDLIKYKYKTHNRAYEFKACHYIRPLDVKVKCGVFCYIEDIGIALSSQIEREFFHNFVKLTDDDTPFSIENWLLLIEKQIDNWTLNNPFPLIIINTDKILDNKDMFMFIFQIPVSGYSPGRKTLDYRPEIKENMVLVERINEKLSKLPDFGVKL